LAFSINKVLSPDREKEIQNFINENLSGQFDIPLSRIPDDFRTIIQNRNIDLKRLVSEFDWSLPTWWGDGWDDFLSGHYPDASNVKQKIRITSHYYSCLIDKVYRKQFDHLEGVLICGDEKIGDGGREQLFTETQFRVYLMKLSNMPDKEVADKLKITRRSANDHWNKIKYLTGRLKSDIPPIVFPKTEIEMFRERLQFDEEITELSNDRSVDKYYFKNQSDNPLALEIEYKDKNGNVHIPSWATKYKIDKDLILEANKLLKEKATK